MIVRKLLHIENRCVINDFELIKKQYFYLYIKREIYTVVNRLYNIVLDQRLNAVRALLGPPAFRGIIADALILNALRTVGVTRAGNSANYLFTGSTILKIQRCSRGPLTSLPRESF